MVINQRLRRVSGKYPHVHMNEAPSDSYLGVDAAVLDHPFE
jgi:hypothetical protein